MWRPGRLQAVPPGAGQGSPRVRSVAGCTGAKSKGFHSQAITSHRQRTALATPCGPAPGALNKRVERKAP